LRSPPLAAVVSPVLWATVLFVFSRLVSSGLAARQVLGVAGGSETAEELLESASEGARLEVRRTKSEAERVARDRRDMSRERLLPDEMTLQKIARYEAHLSRGLYQAMHELEALQTKRTGGAAPLARLDAQGLES
jgi:predicted phage gp36 major capsid-like protein